MLISETFYYLRFFRFLIRVFSLSPIIEMSRKRFKVGDLIQGDIKTNTGRQGAIIEQILTENHPRWKIRWNDGAETTESTRAIKKRVRTYEQTEAEIRADEAEEDIILREALDSLDEAISIVSDSSDDSSMSFDDEFRYLAFLTATFSDIAY